MRLVLYGEPRSSSLPILPANPSIQRWPTKSHGTTTRTSSWAVHVRRQGFTRTIPRDKQEAAADVYLRLYEPLGLYTSYQKYWLPTLTLHSSALVYDATSYKPTYPVTIAQRRCMRDITRNHKCLPPRVHLRQSSGTFTLTPTNMMGLMKLF